jgi:hypothetical protein
MDGVPERLREEQPGGAEQEHELDGGDEARDECGRPPRADQGFG